jgi:Cu+-exporting ATPase
MSCLTESGLEQFYDLSRHPGVRVQAAPAAKDWTFLDQPSLEARLLDFTDGKTNRITLSIPAIHCIACVWLLENLFRLLPGIGKCQVNFPRREVSISFYSNVVKLSQIVALLVSIGYEPELNLGKLDKPSAVSPYKKQWLQIGLAGFAFGNIMLFSLPAYLGLDRFSGPVFQITLRIPGPDSCSTSVGV